MNRFKPQKRWLLVDGSNNILEKFRYKISAIRAKKQYKYHYGDLKVISAKEYSYRCKEENETK